MKHVIVAVILLWVTVVGRSQKLIVPAESKPLRSWVKSDHAMYVGVSGGIQGEDYLRLEHSITDSYILMQISLQANQSNVIFQYKTGLGYAPKHSKFRAYVFMPYLNLNLTEMGYNTPFCVEAFYDKGPWQASLNLDIYTQGTVLVPSIRAKYRILRFKL